MGRIELSSFEAWVVHTFAHEATGPRWYADPDAPFWPGPAARVIECVTRLCEDPVPPLHPYTDAQLNQGFWYLLSNGLSDWMFALLDVSVPVAARLRCLGSFTTVFRQLFAVRCTPHLSHADEPGAAPLNSACYMWWELLPFAAAPADAGRRELDRTALDIMKKVLSMDSIACQESALHGLGHWCAAYPGEVERIVDDFLRRSPTLRPKLAAYARSARTGCVQ